MTPSEYQKNWFLSNRWFDHNTLQAVIARRPAQFHGDLCELLRAFGMIAPEQADIVRQAVVGLIQAASFEMANA
jgi:hypothetical protein